MRFGVSRELGGYNIDLAEVQELEWEGVITEPA
jgi:hypothetical protein